VTPERLSITIVSAPPTEVPVPVVYWPYYRYGKWVVSGFMVLWTLVLWYVTPGNRRFMGSSLYMFFFPMQLYAEIERTVTGAVRFRWAEGRRTRSVAANPSVPFLNDVKRAVVTAVRHISDGIQTVVITTSDATYPQISASGYRSGDLLKQLKRRVQ
jgi:hypothetical protein